MSTASSATSTASVGGSGGGGGAPPGPPPPIPPLVEEDLGLVGVAPITFEIPENTLGFTAVANVAVSDQFVGFYSLEAPDGTMLVDEFGIAGTQLLFLHYGHDAMAVPMTDDAAAMPPTPGTWTITPLAEAAQEVELSIWRRQTLDGAFHGGVVDVNVFIVDGAVTEAYATDVVDGAFEDFAGLGVGDITFSTLPAQFSVVDEATYFTVIEQTAGAAGKPALNLIFTHEIASGAAGYSPAAPGLPLVHGTKLSGVVMTKNGTSIDSLVVRHEMGHFAGLTHTSEFEPGLGDRLGDTPLCADVMATGLACPDVDYLMFAFAAPNSPFLFSPQQEKVVQASTLYRGAVEPNGGFAEPLDRAPDAAVAGGEARARGMAADEPGAGDEWQQRHAPALVRFASAHWCNHRSGRSAPADGLAMIRGLAGEGELWTLAGDVGAPPFVRARAMRAAAGPGLDAHERAALTGWATSVANPRRVRAGAMMALSENGEAAPRVVDDAVLVKLSERLR
jgi:hypothetical protein